MSDLREWLKDASLTEIEAELQKRDRLRDQINDAYVRTEDALTEANKLLEQTIEVLEILARLEPKNRCGNCRFCGTDLEWGPDHTDECPFGKAKPLLDNLKARKP